MSVISVKNLSKSYQFYRKEEGLKGTFKAFFKREILEAEAVKNVSFEIEEGELVGFLGPNGAGKTTTLKMLSGIVEPSKGQVSVLGFYPYDRKKKYQKQFGMVMGQKNQLLYDIPAQESFRMIKEIYDISDQDYQETLQELTELFEAQDFLDINVRKLSLGQRMKCELIAALLHRPKVLFLDEPTIGLDVVAQKNIRDFLQRYNQEKKITIILTSHYMEDIRQLCKRVVVINKGTIIYDGDLEKLIAKYAPHKILKLILSRPVRDIKDLSKYGEMIESGSFNCTLRVSRKKAKQVAGEILNSDLPVEDILIDELGIDEVIRMIFNNK